MAWHEEIAEMSTTTDTDAAVVRSLKPAEQAMENINE
jgi:hypothetical protein